MEKQLNDILEGNQAINAAVSGRISLTRRDDAFPAIVYERTGRREQKDASGRPMGLVQSDFNIGVLARTHRQAREIADLISAVLNNYRGQVLNINIMLTEFNDESPADLPEQDIREITLSYTFHHSK